MKYNHVEKMKHPCQFPVELVERLVLGMTEVGGLVFDPFMGVGSTAIAAVKNARRSAGADIVDEYLDIAEERLRKLAHGQLRTRPMGKSVHKPSGREKVAQRPLFNNNQWQ